VGKSTKGDRTDETSTAVESRHTISVIFRGFSAIFLWRAACIYVERMLNGIGSSLESYLDLLSVRQKLIASNVANVDTPGYKTQDVDFQTEFQNLLQGGQAHATEVTGLKTNNDGNNVSMDREARLLSENALRFSAVSQLLRGQIRLLKSAIDEGKNG